MQRVLRAEKNDWLAVAAIAVLAAATALLVPAEHPLWVWIGVAGLIVVLMWSRFGDPLTLVLAWFVTSACFSYFFWRAPLPGGLLHVTVDRLFMLVVVTVMVLSLVVGRVSWRPLPAVVKLAVVMAGYFSVSLLMSGFASIADVTPHFRLVGGYYFPIIGMVIAYLAVRDERQAAKLAWFFLAFGLYLTVTAWAEYFGVWELVFPRYIADQELGIHWGRARGPFLVSPSLGVTLVFCFFSNLYLAGRMHGPARLLVYAADLLMVPAIFFTLTRSVWLAMVVCLVIYIAFNRRVRTKAGVFAGLGAVAVVLIAVLWPNLTSRDRATGGVSDPYPIYARVGLAKISMKLFSQQPVFGVGFGHFRDAAVQRGVDPASVYMRFASQQMEHNNFLSVLTETGVVGLVLYVLVLIGLLRVSLRVYRRLSPTGRGWMTRDFVVLYWIMFANYLIDAMFRETSVDPFNNSLFFVLSGMVLGMDFLLAGPAATWSAARTDRADAEFAADASLR